MPTPQTSSQYAYDGVVPGTSWDDFLRQMQRYTSSDLIQNGQLHGTVGNLPVYGYQLQTNIGQNSGEGQGFGTPTYSSDPSTTTYSSPDLGNGTHNVYSRNPDGTVQSHNETINNDSWWDSTGLPLLAATAFGGATAGLSAAGVGVSGAGAGAVNVGAGLGSLNLPGAAGAGGIGAGATSVATGSLGDYMPYEPGGSFQNVGAGGEYVSGAGTAESPALQTAAQIGGGVAPSSGLSFQQLLQYLGAGGAALGGAGALASMGGSAGSGMSPGDTGAMDQTGSQGSNLPNSGSSPSMSQILQALKTGGGALQQLFGGGGNGTSGDSSGSVGGGLNLANLLQGLGQTAGGILSASELKNLGNQIVNTADPFHQYRQQYASQLNGTVQAPGYADQFKPTAMQNYAATNTPQGALAGLNGFQTDPGVASSYAALNGLGTQNAGDYGALSGIGSQYAALLKDPNQIFNDTAYKAQTAQGTEALNRTLAARGQTASGNEMQALQDYGTANAGNYYNQRLNQLGTGYNQDLSAMGQQYNQSLGTAGANLARNGQQYGQAYQTGLANMQAQGQGFNQQGALFQQGLAGNQQQYGQLAQMSGLSQSNLGAAAQALGQQYNAVQGAYGQAGNGLSTLFGGNGTGGIAGGLGAIGSSLSNLFGGSNTSGASPDTSWLNDMFGAGSTDQTFSGMTNNTGNAFLNALNGYGTTNTSIDPISLFGWS